VLDLDTSNTLTSSPSWFFKTRLGSASPTSRVLDSEEATGFVVALIAGLETAPVADLAFFAAGAVLGGAGFSASRFATRADLLGTKVASVMIFQGQKSAIECG
jgi:hypothetical protein